MERGAPNAERTDDESHTQARVAREVLEIDFARQQRFGAALEHDNQLAEPMASGKSFMPAISNRRIKPAIIFFAMPGPS